MLLAAAPLLLLTSASPPPSALPSLHLATEALPLPAGGVVYLHDMPGARRVLVHTAFPTGAADDPPDRAGMAHLAEHLSFAPPPDHPDWGHDRLLEAVGGSSNAWTDRERSGFYSAGPPEALERLLYLESRRMSWEGVSEEGVRAQASVVLQERSLDLSRAHGGDLALLDQLLWPAGHPWHRPVVGEPLGVQAITGEELQAFTRARYHAGAVRVVVAGQLPPGTKEAVLRWYGGLAAPAPVAPVALPLPASPPVEAYWPSDVGQTAVYAAWRLAPLSPAQERVLELVGALASLATARGGALEGEEVSVRVSGGARAARVVVSWIGEPEGAARGWRRVERWLNQLQGRGPSRAAQAQAGWEASVSWVRKLEGLEARAELMNLCALSAGDPDCLAARLAAIQALSPEEVAATLHAALGRPPDVRLSVIPPDAPPPCSGRGGTPALRVGAP